VSGPETASPPWPPEGSLPPWSPEGSYMMSTRVPIFDLFSYLFYLVIYLVLDLFSTFH